MVEGHQVARTAAAHRATLAGRKFKAESPNGRFIDGAKAIHQKRLLDVQSVGKQVSFSFRLSFFLFKSVRRELVTHPSFDFENNSSFTSSRAQAAKKEKEKSRSSRSTLA